MAKEKTEKMVFTSEDEKKKYLITIIDEEANEKRPEDTEEMQLFFEQNNTYAVLGNAMLPIRIYDPRDIEYTDQYVYLSDGFFYLYKGSCLKSVKRGPGIYFDPEEKRYYLVPVDPSNPRDVEQYRVDRDKLAIFDNETILEELRKNAKEMYSTQKHPTKAFYPKINPTDDMLKRITKMALIAKKVDLDQCRDRFSDKNALFNYKQIIKNDSKMSMFLFERGLNALHLKCRIIVEEIDPKNCVGDPMDPIEVSSDDTYDL